jgi:hypothetical protein
MLDQTVIDWGVLVAVIVAAMFVLDLSLTVLGARASERIRDRWSVEGSYELNPRWQSQIDAGRLVSPRLVLVAVAIPVLLIIERQLLLVAELDTTFFAAGIGAFLLVQAPTIMTHLGNLTTVRDLADLTAVEGRIRLSRWFVYRQSAWHYARFSALWLLLWAGSQQAFFLGGAFSCAVIATQHRHLGSLARAGITPPVAESTLP